MFKHCRCPSRWRLALALTGATWNKDLPLLDFEGVSTWVADSHRNRLHGSPRRSPHISTRNATSTILLPNHWRSARAGPATSHKLTLNVSESWSRDESASPIHLFTRSLRSSVLPAC